MAAGGRDRGHRSHRRAHLRFVDQAAELARDEANRLGPHGRVNVLGEAGSGHQLRSRRLHVQHAMATKRPTPQQHDTPIPEFDDHDDQSAVDRLTQNVVNTFTVERDTSLADGAGAPGSTDVGGSRQPDRGADDEPER